MRRIPVAENTAVLQGTVLYTVELLLVDLLVVLTVSTFPTWHNSFGFVHTSLQLTYEYVAKLAVCHATAEQHYLKIQIPLCCHSMCVAGCSVCILPISLSLWLFLLFPEKLSIIDDVTKYRRIPVSESFCDELIVVGNFLTPRIPSSIGTASLADEQSRLLLLPAPYAMSVVSNTMCSAHIRLWQCFDVFKTAGPDVRVCQEPKTEKRHEVAPCISGNNDVSLSTRHLRFAQTQENSNNESINLRCSQNANEESNWKIKLMHTKNKMINTKTHYQFGRKVTARKWVSKCLQTLQVKKC